MDNLTHSLAGALLGQMGLKRKTGLAMPTLIIAANLPDIDAVAVLLGGHQHLAIRRGITHGPIAMLLLPILLWAVMLAWNKWRPNEKRLPVQKGWLLALAYIGTLSHPALDWLNNYGIRLLEPFSSQWFYGDTIFIIDLWIWAALIAGVWFSRRREKRGAGNWRHPAMASFFALCAYIFGNGVITGQAESGARDLIVKRYDATATMPEPLVVANPVPVAFWQREIVWRDGQDYGSGHYSLGSGASLSPQIRPHHADAVPAIAKQSRDAAAYLFWSRMPVVKQKGQDVVVQDQRFMDPRVGDRFTLRVKAAEAQPTR